jgi:hypothetical protein
MNVQKPVSSPPPLPKMAKVGKKEEEGIYG